MGFCVSGILIAKNLVSQGYPFVEAIESIIPFCSEIIISEGFSTDGTFEILSQMQKNLGSFMKIYRREWQRKSTMGNAFATEFNFINEKCIGSHILRIDPDHVFHPGSLKEMELTARSKPSVNFFWLPYITYVGQYMFKYIWANNFFRNEKHIRAVRDSGAWRYSARGLPQLMMGYLRRPRTFLGAILHGMADFRYNIYLTTPVFHYHAIFPGNYLERIKQHQRYYTAYDWTNYQRVLPLLEKERDWHKFWDIVVKQIYSKQKHYQEVYPVCELYEGYPPHPPVMSDIWGNWTYSPAELFESEVICQGGGGATSLIPNERLLFWGSYRSM